MSNQDENGNAQSPAMPLDFAAMTSEQMIVATLNTFSANGVVEIRCLGVGGRKNRTDSGYFDSFSTAASVSQVYLNDGCTRGVYFVLNEFSPELMARASNRFEQYATTTTNDAAILSRRWLYVDCDPVRPAGISSNESQLLQSIERCVEVADWLAGQGLCEPITAMSGNGAHCHLPISLPNDAGSLGLVSGVLRTLDSRFSDNVVKIDTAVSNAARICRLYGTIARKGDSTADRPHRMARLLFVPDYIERRTGEVCDVDVLRAVAAMSEPEHKAAVSVPASVNGHSNDKLMLPHYLRDCGIEYTIKTSGEFTNYILSECVFNADHKSPDAMISQGSRGGVAYRCLHDSCNGKDIRDVYAALGKPSPEHYDPPRPVSDNRPVDLSLLQYSKCTATGESTTTVTVPRVLPSFSGIDAADLASYASQEPDWLVTGVFSIDEPLLVGARSKCCKTLQLTDLAVAVATGTQWLGAFEVPKQRKVLFITGETNFRRAAKHVEKACEARGLSFPDVSGWLRVEAAKFPTLPDLGHQAGIAADVKEHGFELVICDPLYRGLSGVDSSRLNEIGPAIKRFQAACQPACLVLSHHVIKTAAREYGNPPSLEDMTGAGIAESCGQWWLVGRNSKYEWNWQHDLCVQFGGRDGQGGGRRVLFDESAWTCQVDGWHDYVTEADQEQQRRKDDARREADELKMQQARARILKACRNVKVPQSRSRIRDSSGQSGISFGSAFAEMTRDQTLVQRPYRDGAKRIQPEGWLLREYAAEYDAEWTRSEITDDHGR